MDGETRPVDERENALTDIARAADLLDGYRSACRGGAVMYPGDFSGEPERLRSAIEVLRRSASPLPGGAETVREEGPYEVRVSWSAEDGEYVATSPQFPGLSYLHHQRSEAVIGFEQVASVADDLARSEAAASSERVVEGDQRHG